MLTIFNNPTTKHKISCEKSTVSFIILHKEQLCIFIENRQIQTIATRPHQQNANTRLPLQIQNAFLG